MKGDRITKVADPDGFEFPIGLELAKSHLGVTHDEQDTLIKTHIEAAFEWAEERTGRAIASRDYLVTRDGFPTSPWCLPLGHVTAIGSVQYLDADGVLQTWTASPLPYETDLASDFQARLRPKPSQSWPSTGSYLGSARTTLTAGWTQGDIPYTLRTAILLKLGALMGSRMPGDEDPTIIDDYAESMLESWRLPVW